MKQLIIIGADHAGFKLKQSLAAYLRRKGYNVVDLGAKRLSPSDDYPDYAFPVGRMVARRKAKGILVCGSAEGICIAANKVKGVRAVPVWTKRDAALSRRHNDANILCLSGWALSSAKARGIVDRWLRTDFCGEERHARRIRKISRFEGR